MKAPVINKEFLRRHCACEYGIIRFNSIFPYGIKLTRANFKKFMNTYYGYHLHHVEWLFDRLVKQKSFDSPELRSYLKRIHYDDISPAYSYKRMLEVGLKILEKAGVR